MSQAVLYTYHQYIVGFMLTGALPHRAIYLFLLEITIWNKIRIIYSRIDFFFLNINSTIINWLIYTFSSQLNTFCMLHVILCFHQGKDIHNPNDPLRYFCMLGFLGCEMCLFRKLYVEGFIDIFGEVFFFWYLFDLE